MTDFSANGTLDERLFSLQDANGSLAALSDTTGSSVERCLYEPYGAISFFDASFGALGASITDNAITFTGHTASVLGVAFSPDGERIASSSDVDQTVQIWDSRTGEQIAIVRQGQPDTRRLAFSPDGTRLATISYGKYSLWDTQTWHLIEEVAAHHGLVRCVTFSPDGTRFATGGDDTKIKLWETATGRLISTLSGHAQTVWSVAFSPDGSRLVSGSKDSTVKIWDTYGSNDLKLREHSAACSSVAFSRDGKRFASGSSDGTIILWDSQTSESLFTMQGHVGYVNELSFSPDGNRLASGGDDQTARLWDTHTGEEVAVLKGHTSWVRGVAFSPDGKQLASAGWEGALKLWDAHSHREIATLTGHRGGLYCVAYSPDGSCLASASYDQTVKLWDAQSGQEIRTFQGHTGLVRTLAFGPEGERLVSAGYDPKVRVWDVSSGVQIAAAERSSAAIFGVAFCPDGKRIATICTDAAIHLFDARTGAEIMPLYSGGSSAVTFSPDGNRLVAVEHSGVVRILDARRDHETTMLRGHANAVTSVTFSPDGSRIYSESESEKLVWDVATRETIRGATWEPMQATTHFSPDRLWFVTSEANDVVLVDLEYKNTPYETEWRIAKARFDSLWHQEQATAATTVRNWYAAVFHDAWLVKHDPNQASCYGRLQSSFQELKSQFEQEGRNLDPHLASVVKEALKHVDEWTNSGFEEPRIQKSTWAFQATIPHWNTTGEMFEIWSSGFQGVTAHDGDQFVELNANEEGTLYQDLPGIERDALLEFSFAHRGRNGEDTLKLTITDLGADNSAGGGDDRELFAKEYTTGNNAWAVYDGTTEPAITALGNKVRFAYSAVHATGGRGPDNTEGNFLDAAEFGVGVVTTRREAGGVK